MSTVRVLTYNIAGARYRAPLRDVVRAVAPDVLVVNETPKLPLLWRWQCARLAAGWGLRRAAGGRDAGSNMICVSPRVHVLATSVRRLRQPLFAPRRGVVTAQCEVDGVEFGVVGVHLSLLAERRPAEAQQAVLAADALRGPVVMCGDLNEPPDRPAWQLLRQAGYVDCGDDAGMTFSTANPVKRIDAVLVRAAVVRSYGVPDVGVGRLRAASDHFPVQAVVELPGTPVERGGAAR